VKRICWKGDTVTDFAEKYTGVAKQSTWRTENEAGGVKEAKGAEKKEAVLLEGGD
jgi:hypothetical protein